VQVQKAASYLGIDLSGVENAPPIQAVVPLPKVDVAQQRLSDEVRNMTLATELGQSFGRQKDEAQLLKLVRQNAQVQFNLEEPAVFVLGGIFFARL